MGKMPITGSNLRGEYVMNYVELTEQHYPVIAKHYVETYNAPPWNDRWTEELAEEKLREMMDCSGAFGLICYDDSGSFSGVILGNIEIYFDCKQFFIKDFFVPLSCQNQGIGSLLMGELEKRLREMGIHKTYLFTAKGERTEGYYQRRGFVRWDDMILMGKKL